MLVVDITSADAAHSRLGRYKVLERRGDGSLVLAPESVDGVEEFLDALDRLDAAASQHSER